MATKKRVEKQSFDPFYKFAQLVGIIGALILIVFGVSMLTFYSTIQIVMPMMIYSSTMYYSFIIIGILGGIVGIVGAFMRDPYWAGALMLIGAMLSVPLYFGFFGIAFLLMVLSGLTFLSFRK